MLAPILKLVINEDTGKTEYHQLMSSSENTIVQKIRGGEIVHELSYTKDDWQVVLNKVFPIFQYDFDLKFDSNDYYLKICQYTDNISSNFLKAIKTYFTNLLLNY